MTLCAGERENLRADNRGRAMHFAEVRERELYREKERSSLEAFGFEVVRYIPVGPSKRNSR